MACKKKKVFIFLYSTQQEPGLQEESSYATSEINAAKEEPVADYSTLLHQHMNQELQGVMVNNFWHWLNYI